MFVNINVTPKQIKLGNPHLYKNSFVQSNFQQKLTYIFNTHHKLYIDIYLYCIFELKVRPKHVY